jgi:hypothetical protein
MMSLMPIGRVISVIAAVYAVLICALFAIDLKLGNPSRATWASLRFAISGGTVLQAALMLWFYFGWRYLWRWFPPLNRLLFPDIGGDWAITIRWRGGGNQGVVRARAVIRQDFLKVSMEVRSPQSESQTLIAEPKKDAESGRPILYYVYLVVPNATGTGPALSYNGAAILKFDDVAGGRLHGNYWTSKETSGHFELTRG